MVLMKIFLCPDKFKGSATTHEVIEALSVGISRVMINPQISSSPISDGGEGFAQIASEVLDGRWISCSTVDALHRPIEASYYLVGDSAYIDMSAASGLVQIDPSQRDPLHSSTRGTGMLMKHAIENYEVEQIYVGLGGSATNDGGVGMAHELGIRFLDGSGKELTPTPYNLMHCQAIDSSNKIKLPKVIAACDVNNPLLGDHGATFVYGPQKGATELTDLEMTLTHLVYLTDAHEAALEPGAGAAGGIGFGLLHFAGATLAPGFDLIAEMTQLEKAIEDADIVITGEGSLDAQTLNGKGPHGVALMAKKHNKPVYAIAGSIDSEAAQIFDDTLAITSLNLPLETCMRDAIRLIADLAEQLLTKIHSS